MFPCILINQNVAYICVFSAFSHYLGESDFDSDDTEMKAPHKKWQDYIPALCLPSTSAQAPPIPLPPNVTPQVTPPVAAKAQPTYMVSLPEMNTTTLDSQHIFHPSCRMAWTGTGQIPCTGVFFNPLHCWHSPSDLPLICVAILGPLCHTVFMSQRVFDFP